MAIVWKKSKGILFVLKPAQIIIDMIIVLWYNKSANLIKSIFDMEEFIMSKLRVYWIPQVGISEIFYVPVNTPEEGKKLLDTLAAYDAFQLQNNVKPDYCNVGGLEMFDEEDGEWYSWDIETNDYYYDDLNEYCKSGDCEQAEELEQFQEEVFKQIDWNKMPN